MRTLEIDSLVVYRGSEELLIPLERSGNQKTRLRVFWILGLEELLENLFSKDFLKRREG